MNKHSKDVVKSSEVIGKKIVNSDKENLGKVEEIVLAKTSGEVRYAVLSFGGFMGMGTDFYALPWKSLSYCNDTEAFIVNINKEKLKHAKGFNKDHWPDFSDEAYIKQNDSFYM